MVTNQRRPIVTIVEDITPGIYDTVMAAWSTAAVPCWSIRTRCGKRRPRPLPISGSEHEHDID